MLMLADTVSGTFQVGPQMVSKIAISGPATKPSG